ERLLANRAQIGRHLVGEHLDQAEAEQVRRVAAVGKRGDVAADAGRAARPAVARSATVRQSRAEPARLRDIAARVLVHARPQALVGAELTLEQLPAAADRARRI